MIRMLVAAAVAMAVVAGRHALPHQLAASREIGQPIREDGPQGHITKAGTPTMGGVGHRRLGGLRLAVGRHRRRARVSPGAGRSSCSRSVGAGARRAPRRLDQGVQGAQPRAEQAGQDPRAAGRRRRVRRCSCISLTDVDTHAVVHPLRLPGHRPRARSAGPCSAVFLILAATNAVNLTDGLDGLAAGSSIFAFAAFIVIGFWAFRHPTSTATRASSTSPWSRRPCSAACAGFLWWNAAPAQIFMGDTGSLAIGAALAALGAQHQHACCCCRSSAACS